MLVSPSSFCCTNIIWLLSQDVNHVARAQLYPKWIRLLKMTYTAFELYSPFPPEPFSSPRRTMPRGKTGGVTVTVFNHTRTMLYVLDSSCCEVSSATTCMRSSGVTNQKPKPVSEKAGKRDSLREIDRAAGKCMRDYNCVSGSTPTGSYPSW